MQRRDRFSHAIRLKRGADQLLLLREVATEEQVTYVGYLNGVEEVAASDRGTAMGALIRATQPFFSS